jgi:hypothetical protein
MAMAVAMVAMAAELPLRPSAAEDWLLNGRAVEGSGGGADDDGSLQPAW